MSEAREQGVLRPRYCQQCGQPLVIAHDGTRERRGCRHCGWIYDPPPAVAVLVVIEHHDGRIVLLQGYRAELPGGPLQWSEAPDVAALRTAATTTGLHLTDPHFLGFIQTQNPTDPERFVLTFCYVLQSEGATTRLADGAALVRLRDMPRLADEQARYAMDVYRAWLDRP